MVKIVEAVTTPWTGRVLSDVTIPALIGLGVSAPLWTRLGPQLAKRAPWLGRATEFAGMSVIAMGTAVTSHYVVPDPHKMKGYTAAGVIAAVGILSLIRALVGSYGSRSSVSYEAVEQAPTRTGYY